MLTEKEQIPQSGLGLGLQEEDRRVRGLFAGAQGLIMSNFVVSVGGDVVDNHFTRIYVPA